MSVLPNWPVILFMLCCFIIVAAIVTGIVLIIVYSIKGTKSRQHYHATVHHQNSSYPPDFDNNSLTHNPATWGAAHAFNNQDMNNEMNNNGTYFSDKDHDGIPDQVDTHDNRFDHTMSNDSTSSFDTNTWSNDSSSGGSDSGGSSGTTDNNNF